MLLSRLLYSLGHFGSGFLGSERCHCRAFSLYGTRRRFGWHIRRRLHRRIGIIAIGSSAAWLCVFTGGTSRDSLCNSVRSCGMSGSTVIGCWPVSARQSDCTCPSRSAIGSSISRSTKGNSGIALSWKIAPLFTGAGSKSEITCGRTVSTRERERETRLSRKSFTARSFPGRLAADREKARELRPRASHRLPPGYELHARYG